LKIHDALHKFKTVFEPDQGQLTIGLLRSFYAKNCPLATWNNFLVMGYTCQIVYQRRYL